MLSVYIASNLPPNCSAEACVAGESYSSVPQPAISPCVMIPCWSRSTKLVPPLIFCTPPRLCASSTALDVLPASGAYSPQLVLGLGPACCAVPTGLPNTERSDIETPSSRSPPHASPATDTQHQIQPGTIPESCRIPVGSRATASSERSCALLA